MTQAFTAPQIVMAIFDARGQAEAALQGLRQRGFSEDQLSVLVRHDDVTISAERMAAIDEEAEETGTGVAVGGAVGGLAGLLGGLALSAIPGIGPVLGIGVLTTTFGGAALGAALGERWAQEHFEGLGVHPERASRYGAALEAGQIVVAVSARSTDEVLQAREALALHQADEIDVHAVKSGDALPPAA